MKKATTAPPPPRPLSEASSLTGDSDSASVESGLEGRMRLSVFLPDGTNIQMEVERRTAMMDLLVQVTKAHNLNPGSYALDVKSIEGAPYKPNTPIGTLGVSAVHVVPRARDPNSIHRDVKSGTKPFEKTFRLRVHLPRNQLHVLRVSPRMPLAEVFATICSEKALNQSRYELRHPVHEDVQLDHSRCLADYDLSEVALVTLKEPNSGSLKHLDAVGCTSVSSQEHGKKKHGILSFMFKKNKHQSSGGDMDASDKKPDAASPVYCEVISSASPPLPPVTQAAVSFPSVSSSSASDVSSATSNKSAKKRPAPPPPPALRNHDRQTSLPATTSTGNELVDVGMTTFAASHSRHSSDSSGYHESSILSDSPEISGADLECSLHFKGRKAASTTNIHLVDSTSSLSVSSNGTKKRKAPPPPMRSSTLPPTSKQQQQHSPLSSISVSETIEQLSNGSLGSSTISLQSSRSSSTGNENRTEVAPVPKPRHTAPSNHSSKPEGDEDSQHQVNSAMTSDCNGHNGIDASSKDSENTERLVESHVKKVVDNNQAPTVSSRHSSGSSIETKADSPKSAIEYDDHRRTTNEVHDENLKNARKSSIVDQQSVVDSNDALDDTAFVMTGSDSPDIEADKAFSHLNKQPLEEAVLADAINEFHNETNSVKLNLTDLWSQVVTLPPGGVVDRPTDDNNDDGDKLSIEETNLFDLAKNDEKQDNKETSHDDVGGDEDDLSANNVDIYLDNQQSTVNRELDKDVSRDNGDACKSNNDQTDVTPLDVKTDEEPEVLNQGLDKNDDLRLENDLVVTWEYRIPDVPVEFQNDPKGDEVQESNPVVSVVSTKSLTTIYTSPKVEDKIPQVNDENDEEEKQQVVEKRVYTRRPVVQFSISTYRHRASEETSYQDKLGRVDSFSAVSQSDGNSAAAVIHSRSSSEVTNSAPLEPASKEPSNSSSITKDLPSGKADAVEKVQQMDYADEPVKDVQQLQEEYSKLQQQFIQWQRQLLTNQNLLQMQHVLPESTTNPLKPLQEFQDQFTSLPPTMSARQCITKQTEVESNSVSQSVDNVSQSKSTRQLVTKTPSRNPHVPRPWRPVSVDLSPWTQRPKLNNPDYGSKSLNFAGSETDHRDVAVAFIASSSGKGEFKDFAERKSSSKDRMNSFNEHTVDRPVVKINRQVSHAASFPRHPVVRGFATLPQDATPSIPVPSKIQDASKRCVKTVTYFGDPVNNHSKKADDDQQRHISQVQFKNIQRVTNQHKSEASSARKKMLPPTAASAQVPPQVNGNSKFFTVVSVGHAAARQQAASFAPPPPPPPPLLSSAPAKFVKNESNKNLPKISTENSVNTKDDRDELMSAIRDFGGRFGLRKVSAIETRWQSRHGNVN